MSRIAPAWRSTTRIGLAALSSLALAGLALSISALPASAGTGQGQVTNPYSPAYQHSYRHGATPTIQAEQKMRDWETTHGNGLSSLVTGSGPLAYGGGVDGIGVTTGAEKVYLVVYGSQWGTAGTNSSGDMTLSGDTYGEVPRLQELFKGIGTGSEQWSGVMTQYCQGVSTGATSCPSSAAHVGYPTGGAYAGIWYDNSVSSPGQATGNQLANEAIRAAGHFGNTSSTSNRNAQYVILSPTGTHPDGFNTSSGQFCAWHDWNGDSTMSGGAASSSYGDIAFTNMPYVVDMGTSCGENYVNSGSAGTLDGVTMVEGHEYAETITDQNPAGGWTDSTGYENADKCAWINSGTGASANVSFTSGTFAMQTTYSNDASGCQMYHAIVGGGTSTNDFSMSVSPTSGSVTAGGSASATVSTATTAGSAQTVSLSASGLPSGASASFSPSSVTSGSSSTMTITTSSSTPSGTYTITITGTGSSATHSTTYSLSVSGGSTGCTSSGQKLGNPGFESGNTVWSSTSGVIGQYGSSGEPPHSGTWDAWLDGYGATHTDTLSQAVSLPSGCSSYAFSFYLHIDTSETTTSTAYDTLKVQVLNSSGSVLATLATYSNLNHNTGYVQKSFSLASYAGQTVTLKFTGTEDVSLQTSFVIDDTAVNVS